MTASLPDALFVLVAAVAISLFLVVGGYLLGRRDLFLVGTARPLGLACEVLLLDLALGASAVLLTRRLAVPPDLSGLVAGLPILLVVPLWAGLRLQLDLALLSIPRSGLSAAYAIGALFLLVRGGLELVAFASRRIYTATVLFEDSPRVYRFRGLLALGHLAVLGLWGVAYVLYVNRARHPEWFYLPEDFAQLAKVFGTVAGWRGIVLLLFALTPVLLARLESRLAVILGTLATVVVSFLGGGRPRPRGRPRRLVPGGACRRRGGESPGDGRPAGALAAPSPTTTLPTLSRLALRSSRPGARPALGSSPVEGLAGHRGHLEDLARGGNRAGRPSRGPGALRRLPGRHRWQRRSLRPAGPGGAQQVLPCPKHPHVAGPAGVTPRPGSARWDVASHEPPGEAHGTQTARDGTQISP